MTRYQDEVEPAPTAWAYQQACKALEAAKADRDRLAAEVARLTGERDVLLREAEVTDLVNSRLHHTLLNAVLFLRDDTPGPMRDAIQSALNSYADPGSVVPAVAEMKADEELELAALARPKEQP